MSLLTMRFLPDPILRQMTKKISAIPRDLKQYTDDMVETMRDEQGVGLAANQVGSLQRVAVIQLPEWDEPLILINPEIIRREGEREVEEGCLSIPGYRGAVRRSERVRVRAMDLSGKLIRIKADGLLAQALEHETDHLHGKLYIDHLVSRDAIWKISYNPQAEDEEADPEAATEGASDKASGETVGEATPDAGGQ